MKKNKISFLLFLSFILSAALFLGSCNNTETSKRGNEVVVNLATEPKNLNVILNGGDSYGRQVAERHLFLTLFDFNPKTLAWEPVLAKSQPTITETAKGQTFTYEILDEAVWDNGKPVTAADYIFTIKAILNPKSNTAAFRSYAECISDITPDATNLKKFTVTVNKKYILTEATLGGISVYPEYHYDPQGLMRKFSFADLADKAKALAKDSVSLNTFAKDFNTKYSNAKGSIVGCGPYEFTDWVSGTKIILTKKQNWWGDKLADKIPFLVAKPTKLTYTFYKENKTAIEALKAGDIDVMAQISPSDYTNLVKDKDFLAKNELFTPPTTYNTSVILNMRNPKLADKRVRKALANLIQLDAIIKNAMQGLAEPSATMFAPSKEHVDKTIQNVTFDLANAKKLLDEAGWKDTNGNGTIDKKINGAVTELNLDFILTPKQRIEVAEMLKENGKKVGINININKQEAAVWKENLAKRAFEIAFNTAAGDPGLDDPEQRWHTKNNLTPSGNETGFGNAKTDALIEKIDATLDRTQRNALYKQLQQIVAEEQPAIFLFAQKERIAANKRFTNIEPSAMRPYIFEQYYQLK